MLLVTMLATAAPTPTAAADHGECDQTTEDALVTVYADDDDCISVMVNLPGSVFSCDKKRPGELEGPVQRAHPDGDGNCSTGVLLQG